MWYARNSLRGILRLPEWGCELVFISCTSHFAGDFVPMNEAQGYAD